VALLNTIFTFPREAVINARRSVEIANTSTPSPVSEVEILETLMSLRLNRKNFFIALKIPQI
jgi:hypothetical protein